MNIFSRGRATDEDAGGILGPRKIIPEVEEAVNYKDLMSLYNEYEVVTSKKSRGGLTGLLIKQLIGSKDTKLETSILKAMIGYHLPKTEFMGHLENLFIIAEDKCAKKYQSLIELMPQMADCLNQLASWLNVSDVKNLKQSSFYLGQWKDKLNKILLLFNEEDSLTEADTKKLKFVEPPADSPKKDEKFTNLFTKARTYAQIIDFLKLTAKVKLEAAGNVLKGNENLGLYAVTFSRELLKVIELCNKILSVYCQDSPSSKE